jgi:hypothetical protein
MARIARGGTVAEAKTKPTGERVSAFLARATDGERRKDCAALVRIMKDASGARATMWGDSIVGFGTREIAYAGGRTADWPIIAFSPRKQDLTLYIGRGIDGLDTLLDKLGKYTLSGGCLHIKRLGDVDAAVLGKVVSASIKAATAKPRRG